MLLKKIGKFFSFQAHPLFFFLLISLPIAIGASYLVMQYLDTIEIEKRFEIACKRGEKALKRRASKESHVQRYSSANPYFLDEQIESFIPLQSEQTELKQLLTHPALKDPRQIQNRLDFISSSRNRLSFSEEAIRSTGTIKEIEEKQRYPIEVDGEDLKKLLCIIEDTPIDSYPLYEKRPQILITDFTIAKKETQIGTTVFEVEMQLLKREFTK